MDYGVHQRRQGHWRQLTMPLGKTGKSILRDFVARYGAKGKGYFYGKENKSAKFAAAVKK